MGSISSNTAADAASGELASAAAGVRRLQLLLTGLLKQSGSLGTQGQAARLEVFYLHAAGAAPSTCWLFKMLLLSI